MGSDLQGLAELDVDSLLGTHTQLRSSRILPDIAEQKLKIQKYKVHEEVDSMIESQQKTTAELDSQEFKILKWMMQNKITKCKMLVK